MDYRPWQFLVSFQWLALVLHYSKSTPSWSFTCRGTVRTSLSESTRDNVNLSQLKNVRGVVWISLADFFCQHCQTGTGIQFDPNWFRPITYLHVCPSFLCLIEKHLLVATGKYWKILDRVPAWHSTWQDRTTRIHGTNSTDKSEKTDRHYIQTWFSRKLGQLSQFLRCLPCL